MKTDKEITGDIFIVPNRHTMWKNSLTIVTGYLLRDWAYYCSMLPEDVELEDSKPVEVWFATPGNDESNWKDHGIDGYPDLKGWRPITHIIPSEIFRGKKEGEVVTFDLPIHTLAHLDPESNGIEKVAVIKVTLTLSQLKYRYRRFGTFEEVLKSVTR